MTTPTPTPRMDIREFSEEGYLHEINRRFLHPLGLALEVRIEEDGHYSLGGVQDYRADPEGMYFGRVRSEKIARIRALEEARRPAREAALGFWVQPDPSEPSSQE